MYKIHLHSFHAFIYINIHLHMRSLSQTFTINRTAGNRGGYLLNSSQPLPPASQTLRHWLGDYCREFTSAHS